MKCLLLCILFLATACNTSFVAELPEPEQKIDGELLLEGVPDPIEPFNRTMFAFNKGVFEYGIYPLAEGYNYVVPEAGRKGIRHFYKNITYPIRLVNNLFQAEWYEAWIETKRFGINTTEGILGFTDPAKEKYRLEEQKEDFGLTLQHYGWEPQMYLFLPFYGGSSERDLIGITGDAFLDPASYYFPASVPLFFNGLSFQAKSIYDVLTQQYDAYELSHLVYSLQRRLPKYKITYDSEMHENCVQTLYALLSKPQNPNFYKLTEEREIEIVGFRNTFKYNVFKQEKPAKTLYILPGLGECRSSSRILALAELAYSQGYNVVSISSPFNWEFLTSSPKGFLPGFIENDLDKIDSVFSGIESDLNGAYGKEHFQGKSLLGMSLGAWYTMNKAARKPNEFEQFLVINPPVNLIDGLNRVDSLFRAPFEKGGIENAKKVANVAALKALVGLASGEMDFSKLPFTQEEASYLIGLNFRLTLKDAIFATKYDEMVSFYEERKDIYKKLLSISFSDYYKKILTKNLLNKDEVKSLSDIRNKESELKNVKGLKFFLTENDFLLDDKQLDWFRENFSDQSYISPTGGHLGNLVQKDVIEKIIKALREGLAK